MSTRTYYGTDLCHHDHLQAKLEAEQNASCKTMPVCPVCKSNKEVNSAQFSGGGTYFCEDFDCEGLWFTPTNNAKLADAALDSLPAGRYQTPSDFKTPGVYQGYKFAFDKVVPVEQASEADELQLFKNLFKKFFPSLSFPFMQTMEEVGGLGRAKYGDDCIEARIGRGDRNRFCERIYAPTILKHSKEHGEQYLNGILHDVYHTRRHQLGAAAFNPMMEFELANLEGEPCATLEIINR